MFYIAQTKRNNSYIYLVKKKSTVHFKYIQVFEKRDFLIKKYYLIYSLYHKPQS